MEPVWSNIFCQKLDEDSQTCFLKHPSIFIEFLPRVSAILENLVLGRTYRRTFRLPESAIEVDRQH